MYDKLGQTALKGKGDKLWYNCSLKDEIRKQKKVIFIVIYTKAIWTKEI